MPAADVEDLLRTNAAAAMAVETSVGAGIVRGPWPQMADTSAALARARS
jgi:hypothetical protein